MTRSTISGGAREPEPFGRGSGQTPCRRGAHTLLPQTEVAEDALNNLTVINERNNAHLFLAFRIQKRVGFPDLFDEFPPFSGWKTTRPRTRGFVTVRGKLVFGYVDALNVLAGSFGLFGGMLVALATHYIGIPTVATNKLKAFVGDVLGHGGDEVAWLSAIPRI